MALVPDAAREPEVWARLRSVTDPELDEPVTELGFVTDVDVAEDGGVHIRFRLPTYWCAANFAFLMADDMRRAVLSLPWVTNATVELGEHMYADAINHGMTHGLAFRDAFGDEADDDLEELRRTFTLKAFQRRQEAVLRHLLEQGRRDPAALRALDVDGLRGLEVDAQGRRLVDRYLALRDSVVGPGGPAFVDTSGAPVAAEDWPAHLAGLRRVWINTEFNGALCRGLLAARFGEEAPEPGSEPTLADFIRRAQRDPRLPHQGSERDENAQDHVAR
ncbi:MAG: metal-sulfur cluster assembly factor [Inquilinus sp.]|uniref:metal-sulfur cluster assembly factor n=1 Tax=Inquilinus sp. TaxID=1932117 RepID=UPI003F3AB972